MCYLYFRIEQAEIWRYKYIYWHCLKNERQHYKRIMMPQSWLSSQQTLIHWYVKGSLNIISKPYFLHLIWATKKIVYVLSFHGQMPFINFLVEYYTIEWLSKNTVQYCMLTPCLASHIPYIIRHFPYLFNWYHGL